MNTKKPHALSLSPTFTIISKKESLFSQNVWTFEELGFKKTDIVSSKKSINFETLIYPWLIDLMKDTIWRKRNAVGTSSLITYIRNIRSLITFASTLKSDIKLKDITFDLMEAYFVDLQTKSQATQSAYFSGFNEIFTCWQEWGFISRELRLLPRELRPRSFRKKNPKALSASVQQQLIEAISPPTEYFHRIILTMLEIGARGQEVLHLRKDSLFKDKHGWYLTRKNQKFNKEITIPVSDTIADILQSQIDITNALEKELDIENEEGFLFVHDRQGELVPFSLRNINYRLKNLCKTSEIVDDLGGTPTISTHSFRHTVGTNLINNGVSQFHVQKFLGHESPQMTSVYAEIHDSTLREALMKSNGKMADIRGRLYSVVDVVNEIDPEEESSENLDIQWLRKNIATQTLANGVCALPIQTSCKYGNACLTCPSFRSGPEHLHIHKEHQARTVTIIDVANERGHSRQAEINSKLLVNLNKIIGALESGE